MQGRVQSLNVSAAAAVTLFEVVRTARTSPAAIGGARLRWNQKTAKKGRASEQKPFEMRGGSEPAMRAVGSSPRTAPVSM
jgi:hypothetical protein